MVFVRASNCRSFWDDVHDFAIKLKGSDVTLTGRELN